MPELLVIGYDSPEKAVEARTALIGLGREYVLQVGDAVVATRNEKGEVKLDQMVNTWTVGAAGGSFWGLLAGLLFFNPILGVVTGAAAGAAAGAFTDYGINDDFMREVSEVLQPGQAALFVLADRLEFGSRARAAGAVRRASDPHQPRYLAGAEGAGVDREGGAGDRGRGAGSFGRSRRAVIRGGAAPGRPPFLWSAPPVPQHEQAQAQQGAERQAGRDP